MAVALFFLTFFFMIPIGFVQAFASIDGIRKVLPFLKPLIDMYVILPPQIDLQYVCMQFNIQMIKMKTLEEIENVIPMLYYF